MICRNSVQGVKIWPAQQITTILNNFNYYLRCCTASGEHSSIRKKSPKELMLLAFLRVETAFKTVRRSRELKLPRSVFKIIDKLQSHGQNRVQHLHYVILRQIVTCYTQYFWISGFVCPICKNPPLDQVKKEKANNFFFFLPKICIFDQKKN